MILSLDVEKAFDQVDLSYLFSVMEKLKIDDKFIAWIKLLYSNPSARILTNRTLSSQFALGRGCKQGCVLSPLLFALALGPLRLEHKQLEHTPTYMGIAQTTPPIRFL